MIGTIRKHQQFFWWTVIVAMTLGLVIYFNPASRYGGGMGSSSSSAPELGSINGEPITPDQLNAARREGRLFFRLQGRGWPDSEEGQRDVQNWAEQSLVLDSLLKEYKFTATTEAAARFTKEQLFGVPPGQSMPQEAFQDFVQNDLMRRGLLTLDDLDRFARHQVAVQYLISLFGMSGKLITPKEVEFTYRRENAPLVAETVSFPTTNYYRAATPTEAELQDYFTKHEADYRLPDRIQVNYVAFEPSNYLTQADKLLGTNFNDKIDEYYHQQGADAFKDENGKTLTSAEAEEKLKKVMRLNAALQVAHKEAYAFLGSLAEGHDDTHPYTAADLARLAQARGLTVKTSEPFDALNGSEELMLPPKEINMLFSLRTDAPDDPGRTLLYAPSPLTNATTVFVAGLQKQFPSQLQTLAAVHDQVFKDYREDKALTLAKEAGENFAAAAQAATAQGKSFDAVCEAQHLKPETLPPFALTDTNLPPGLDRASFQQLQEATFVVPTGQSSKLIRTTDGGVVAFVKQRLPVDEARMAKELPFVLARMRQQRQAVAFQEWFSHQLQLRLIRPVEEQKSSG